MEKYILLAQCIGPEIPADCRLYQLYDQYWQETRSITCPPSVAKAMGLTPVSGMEVYNATNGTMGAR